MKRLAILGGILAALAVPQTARAACGALPFTFTDNSSVVAASTTNANNNFLLGCATAVDSTQIGVAGIFPSQIIPTNGTNATVGGSQIWTFPNGISLGVALPIASGGTGSTTKNFVDLTTVQSIGGAKTFTAALAGTTGTFGNAVTGANFIANAGGYSATSGSSSTFWSATFGGAVSVGAGPTATNVGDFSAQKNMGTVVQSAAGGSTLGNVPPVYTAAGAALAATTHIVQDTVTAGSTGTITVTLSGAAAFASAAYFASVSDDTGLGYPTVNTKTATTFTFNGTSGHVYRYFAIGA